MFINWVRFSAAMLGFCLFNARADSVTLQLRWLHQFQFAGYYIALEKGYYRDAGLDVTIVEGGPDAIKPVDKTLNGDADFAISGSGVIIERMEGKPVVALAAIMQNSAIVWITRKDSHIGKPADLLGHKAYTMPPPESAELLSMLRKQNLSLGDIELQNTSYNIQDLIDGKVDAYDGYISNEPYFLIQENVPHNIISPIDYGINFYGDVLVTSEQYLRKNPRNVELFVKASLRGWDYALHNLDETVALIKDKYAPQKSLDHLYYEARQIRKLVMPDLIQVGHMNPTRWHQIAESYHELGMAPKTAPIDGFIYTPPAPKNYRDALIIAGCSLLLLLIAARFIWRYKSLSAQLECTNRQLEQLATTDELTGLRNRRGFFEQGSIALSQAKRDGVPSSILMLDIDHFKKINDQYGHLAGDSALQAFSEVIKRFGRQHDVIGRIGGEEFVLLLIGANLQHAEDAAHRLLEDVRGLRLPVPKSDKKFQFTVSIGLAEVHDTLDSSLYRSDMALYEAKESGRNQIKFFSADAQAHTH